MEYILTITLLSSICEGSGSASGTEIDKDICQDSLGLPYIPSRRIKGCLRETALDLVRLNYGGFTEKDIDNLFGYFYMEGKMHLENAYLPNHNQMGAWIKNTLNQHISDELDTALSPANIIRIFTGTRNGIQIENGINARGSTHSTRTILQENPLYIFGFSNNPNMEFKARVSLPDDQHLYEFFEACCKATRHFGYSRNRGLGNVLLNLEKTQRAFVANPIVTLPEAEKITINYKLSIDSPININSLDNDNSIIPGANLLGCLADEYLKRHGLKEIDETFKELFLRGKCSFSNITPVIRGKVSAPTPLMLMKIKNANDLYINKYATSEEQWDSYKKQKPTTIEGTFSVIDRMGDDLSFVLTSIDSTPYYHLHGNELYLQDAMDVGYIFGGQITAPAYLAAELYSCLTNADLRFGRSKNTQYGACHLIENPTIAAFVEDKRNISSDENVFVILESDMVVDEGSYVTENQKIRHKIAEAFNLSDTVDINFNDICQYGVYGGFSSQWRMKKPRCVSIKAGSVFCFKGNNLDSPLSLSLGEFTMEGLGKCRLYTYEELSMISKICKEECDSLEGDSQTTINPIASAILVNAANEAIKQYTRNFEIRKEILDAKLSTRIRSFVEEAHSFEELVDLINTMKESDRTFLGGTTRRQLSINLLNDYFGTDIEVKRKSRYEATKTESVDLSNYLRLVSESTDSKPLFDLINQYPDAKKQILSNWEMPMRILIKRLHYEKGDAK